VDETTAAAGTEETDGLAVEVVDADDVVDETAVLDESPPILFPFELPPEPAPVPPPELPLSSVKRHSFTSFTSCSPPTAIGVKVIVHVSVAGPSGLKQHGQNVIV
jgi:hypothetical protein